MLFVGRDLGFDAQSLPGYGAALAAAFVWAGYSILSARAGAVPTDAVAGFCLATGLLSFVCHLLFEATVWPTDVTSWASIVLLGWDLSAPPSISGILAASAAMSACWALRPMRRRSSPP